MKYLYFTLLLSVNTLKGQCDCSKVLIKPQSPIFDSTYHETERQHIAGNVHTFFYLSMIQDDSVKYLKGQIVQSRSGGDFFNVFEGQTLQILFRDSSVITLSIGQIINNKWGGHPIQNNQTDFFRIEVTDSVFNILKSQDIDKITIINQKGTGRKSNEKLNTYKKFKSSNIFSIWICCLKFNFE